MSKLDKKRVQGVTQDEPRRDLTVEPLLKVKDTATAADLAEASPRRYVSSSYNPQPSFGFDIPTLFLIPLETVLAYALAYMGFPPLFIIAVVVVTSIMFAYRDALSLELATRLLRSLIVRIFFRELDSRNSHRIPLEGPVVFVCAPHANQFLDPAVIAEFVPRPISFIIAAKSYRQKIVGGLAKAQRSIPVERAQDLAKSAEGKVTVKDLTVTGVGTKFTSAFNATDSILIASEILSIVQIVSDTELKLKSAHPKGDMSEPQSYKVVPKLDQRDMFKHVWSTLAAGDCIGIFPEGGSHDRTSLLPLKAGVAIMSLGAAALYPGLNVRVVTVGLNYFHGHRFRGRAYVEFGDPFSLPTELIEKYKEGGPAKIAACNLLLDRIREELKAVTVSAPSWDQLQMLWAVRRLYQPTGVRLPPKATVVLIRRLAEGYDKVKDFPEVKELGKEVMEYNNLLKDYGLRDHQVLATTISRPKAAMLLIYRIVLLIMYALLAIPGLLLNAPIALITRSVSHKKANEALKASNVKVQAKDVLASWKVLTFLMIAPLVFVIYPLLAAFTGWMLGYSPLKTWGNFAVLQPFMMYFSVRLLETWSAIVRSLQPLYLVMTDVTGSYGEHLITRRQILKTQVRSLITKFGPQLYGPAFESLQFFGPNGELKKKNIDALDGPQKNETETDATSQSFLQRRQSQVAAIAKRTSEFVGGAVAGAVAGTRFSGKTVNSDFLRKASKAVDASFADHGIGLFDDTDVMGGHTTLSRTSSETSVESKSGATSPSVPISELSVECEEEQPVEAIAKGENRSVDLSSYLFSPGVDMIDANNAKLVARSALSLETTGFDLPEVYKGVLASLENITEEDMSMCLSPRPNE